jgi:metal-sulfur cluster biosynthetic enzyme
MDVKMACWSVTGINNVDVDITFIPEWGPDKMSEDAKLILGID